MVVGNGLMANTFSDYNNNMNIVIFASGVSNSTEINNLEFKRELKLLKKTIVKYPKALLVYFSSCSIYDSSVLNRPYVNHKLEMEDLIKNNSELYLILRISNVVGPQGNATTILNYLVNSIRNNIEISLWKDAERNLIDKDDLKLIVDDILVNNLKNQIVNVALRQSVLVTDIVEQIEKFLNKKAVIKIVEKGNALKINTKQISNSLDKIEHKKGFGVQYIFNLLEKYY